MVGMHVFCFVYRVEQEVFSCQRADVMTLRNELKHLSNVAQQLEPFIRTFTPQEHQQQSDAAQHLQQLLEHIGVLQQSEASLGKIPRSRSRVLGQLLEKVRPERERSKSAGQTEKPLATLQKPPKKSFQQQQHIERLETHIKEKLHEMVCRRQSSKSDTESERKLSKDDRKMSKSEMEQISKLGTKQRITYKKIGKSCDKINNADVETKKTRSESDYQRISDATSQSVKALVHSTPSSPKCKPQQKLQQRKTKVYPYSDGEDNVFYSMHDSADSLSTSSRRSSFDGPDKTLVVFINRRNKMANKQRSWETFPPKRRHHMCHKLSAPAPMPLRKADSFEGHEEAVKSIVAAVQETRRKPKGGGN